MSQARPIAGPQLLIPVPATPMPSPYRATISRAVPSAAASPRSTHTTCAPSLTSRWAVVFPMPEPAPTTATIRRSSSFSGGSRRSLASSSDQYSMSKASCGSMAS